jgi:hypothetical protein
MLLAAIIGNAQLSYLAWHYIPDSAAHNQLT